MQGAKRPGSAAAGGGGITERRRRLSGCPITSRIAVAIQQVIGQPGSFRADRPKEG